MSAKRYIFDSCFFTYSAWLAVYAVYWLTTQFGVWSDFANEENAVHFMGWASVATLSCAVMMVGLTWALHKYKISTLGEVLFSPATEPRRWFKTFWGLHLALIFLLTLLISLKVTEFSFAELTDPDGVQGALRLYHGLTHANLALLPVAIVQVIETIFFAFLATVLALPMAFVLSFLSAKNLMRGAVAFVVYAVLRTLLNIVRSVEPLIWALIFTVWVGVGPFAGMLALMTHSVAALAKQCSEVIEDVGLGPIEGVLSTGARPLQVIWFAVVPQVLMQFVAFSIYRWDTNVRMATVIGLVGGGGIGTLLLKYQGQAMWPEVGCIILVIAAAVWLMDLASAYIREALK